MNTIKQIAGIVVKFTFDLVYLIPFNLRELVPQGGELNQLKYFAGHRHKANLNKILFSLFL